MKTDTMLTVIAVTLLLCNFGSDLLLEPDMRGGWDAAATIALVLVALRVVYRRDL